MRHLSLLGPLAVLVALAGCQTAPAPSTAPVQTTVAKPAGTAQTVANRNSALNGRWVPGNAEQRSIYFATFRNGSFVSADPETKQALARGRYTVSGDTVNITYQSAARGTVVNLNCSRRGATTLSCVPAGGNGAFTLVRA